MNRPAFPFQRHWPERCPLEGHDLLFDTPDRLLTLLLLSPADMVLGYRQLLNDDALPQPFWRLEHDNRPGIEPLSGALIRVMLSSSPELLQLYQAVDRRSGGDGDAHYLERLQLALQPQALVEVWRNIGELRGELDHQLRLVRQQRRQLDEALALQQRSQRLLDQSVMFPPQH